MQRGKIFASIGAIPLLNSFIARLTFAFFFSLAAELKNPSVYPILYLLALVVSSESSLLEAEDCVQPADLPVENDISRQTTPSTSLGHTGSSAFFYLRSRLSRALRPSRRVRRFGRPLLEDEELEKTYLPARFFCFFFVAPPFLREAAIAPWISQKASGLSRSSAVIYKPPPFFFFEAGLAPPPRLAGAGRILSEASESSSSGLTGPRDLRTCSKTLATLMGSLGTGALPAPAFRATA